MNMLKVSHLNENMVNAGILGIYVKNWYTGCFLLVTSVTVKVKLWQGVLQTKWKAYIAA